MTLRRPPADTPKLYTQDGKGYRATVHAHYFLGANDWLVTEYDPAEDVAFGWACINADRQNAELGYVSLAELEAIQVPLRVRLTDTQRAVGFTARGIGVEYDEYWQPATLEEAIDLLDRRSGRTADA